MFNLIAEAIQSEKITQGLIERGETTDIILITLAKNPFPISSYQKSKITTPF